LYKNLRVQSLILNDSAINSECEKLAGFPFCYELIWIPAFGISIGLPLRRNPLIVLITIQLLFHAKAPRQNTKAAKNFFAALRNLSAFA
jgi:hypothetical protein